jgi:replicative DNA helicase
MLERDAIFKVAAIISTNAFYKEEHQKIFETVSELSAGNHAIDLLTVVQRLKDKQILNEVGGPGYITGLTGRVSSAAHIEQHARIISDKFFQREIIRFSGTLQNAAYQDDIDNLQMLYAVETQAIDNLMAGASGMMHIRDIIKHTTAAIEERVIKAKKGITPGVHTGFADLNSFTNGWQPSDVIVIAARPSMGKTAFAIALAKAAAQKDTPTDVFSLEMSNLKLSTRMILSNGGIDRDRLEKGTMTDGDWKAYNQSASELSKLPVYIDDTAKTNTKRIDAIVRTKARKGECGLAIVDYLQLAEYVQAGNKYGNKNREQEVAGMSRDLKLTAKAANIPMIILSQLNRGIENRENKAPKLSDLRESGAIEQDADVVIMLWRPCYYDEEASDAQGNSLKNLIFLEVVKNREGRLGTIILKHNEDLTEFYDFNTHNQQDPNAWMND